MTKNIISQWVTGTLTVSLIGTVGCGGSEELMQDDQFLSRYQLHNWMSQVPDSTLIRNMSIPGTHDSGSYNFTGIGSAYENCQDMNIREQLNNGIRFLDIRVGCSGSGRDLKIVHGKSYTNLDLGRDVLDKIQDFLNDNPSEFVIARVMKQGKDDRCTNTPFMDRFNYYFDRYRTAHDRMEAGRIIHESSGLHVNRIKGNAKGTLTVLPQYLPGTPASENYTEFYSLAPLSSQDNSDPSGIANRAIGRKKRAVRNHFNNLAKTSNTRFWVNWTSASKWNCGPQCFADPLNEYTYDFLKNRNGRTGIVSMDFPDRTPGLIERIISKN